MIKQNQNYYYFSVARRVQLVCNIRKISYTNRTVTKTIKERDTTECKIKGHASTGMALS